MHSGREQADGIGLYFAAFKISELRSRYFSVRSVISRPKSRPSGRLASKRTCGCSPRFPRRILLRNLLRGPLKSAGKKQSGGLFLRPRVPGLGACYRGQSNLLCNLSRGPLVRVPPWWLTFWFALCVLGFGSQGLSANQYATGILVLTLSSGSKRKKAVSHHCRMTHRPCYTLIPSRISGNFQSHLILW